jgi:hypothetical protein
VAGLSFGAFLRLRSTVDISRSHHADPGIGLRRVGGSLPAEVAQQRLQQALMLAELSPEEFVGALLPTMFFQATPQEAVDPFRASMLGFHPAGFRAMARASAEDLREVLATCSCCSACPAA